MSGTLNRVTLIGNLGADPELRYTADNKPVANFRIATSEPSKNGQTRTEWHRIVAWGKQAEACGQVLTKGQKVCVEGRLQTREWTNREGAKQSTKEVVADRVTFLSPKASAQATAGASAGIEPAD